MFLGVNTMLKSPFLSIARRAVMSTTPRQFSAGPKISLIEWQSPAWLTRLQDLVALQKVQHQLQQTTISPTGYSLASLVDQQSTNLTDLVALGRNSRRPKKANHGKRPCSHVARRLKRRRFGNPRR